MTQLECHDMKKVFFIEDYTYGIADKDENEETSKEEYFIKIEKINDLIPPAYKVKDFRDVTYFLGIHQERALIVCHTMHDNIGLCLYLSDEVKNILLNNEKVWITDGKDISTKVHVFKLSV